MGIATVIAAIMLSQGSAAAAHTDVAYEALAAGNDQAAVAQLGASAPESSDPAQLINLGVAYARQGDAPRARAMFERAAMSSERYDLETASGQWVDSRKLALQALAALGKGTFGAGTRTAMR